MYIRRRRLVRSANGPILGVCEGIARYNGVEAWIVRLAWVLSVLLFGTGILFYVIAGLVLPREDRLAAYESPQILGVCNEISRRWRIELAAVRLVAVLSLFFSVGLSILAYFILWLVFPPQKIIIHQKTYEYRTY